MPRCQSECLPTVTTSFTTLAHQNLECAAPRVVPCHAQNLTNQGSGRVMHDELFVVDGERIESDAGTVRSNTADLRTAFFVKRSRHHHCNRQTFQPSTRTSTSLGQRSLTRRRGPPSGQEMLGQLWVVVVHIVGTPCFIVLVRFWHRSPSSACAHLLLPNCAVWPPCLDCPNYAVVCVVDEFHGEVLRKL